MILLNYYKKSSHAELDSASHETLNQVQGDEIFKIILT